MKIIQFMLKILRVAKKKLKWLCENMSVFSDSEREKIQKKYPHHNIIYVIIIPHSYGRSFAMPSLEPSKAFVYAGYNKQSNEFAHEILHLYGAKDFFKFFFFFFFSSSSPFLRNFFI